MSLAGCDCQWYHTLSAKSIIVYIQYHKLPASHIIKICLVLDCNLVPNHRESVCTSLVILNSLCSVSILINVASSSDNPFEGSPIFKQVQCIGE
eukprot:m.271156 g.271156  ORF g.271156 m.271156 type:complete len:94 (+) comp16267_c1_seq9:2006-2287(+)